MNVEEDGFRIMELARMLCVSDVRQISKNISKVQLPGDDVSSSQPTERGVPKEEVTTANDSNNSQFIRLPHEVEMSLSAENENGRKRIERLEDLLRSVSKSEEFCSSLSEEQWLRTVVTGFKPMVAGSLDVLDFSVYDIRSNVVPCQPYWKKLKRARSSEKKEAGATSSGVYFPSSSLGNDVLHLTREDRVKQECSILKGWIKRYKDEMNGQTDMNKKRLLRREIRRKIEPSGEDRALKASSSEENDSENRFRVEFWNGVRFGVKVFRKFKEDEDTFVEEVKVIEAIGTHPNIVHSFGVSEPEGDDGYKYWMELLDEDLHDFIKKNGVVPFVTVLDSMDVLLQIAEAMKHVHEKKVIHGDLKSANIVMSRCEVSGSNSAVYIVKVTDFDRATIIQPDDDKEEVPISWSDEYMAPEALEARIEEERENKKAREKGEEEKKKKLRGSSAKICEVYSFGIVALEVLGGKIARVQDDPVKIMNDVKALKIYGSHPDLMALVKKCLNDDPSRRPKSFECVTATLKQLFDEELKLIGEEVDRCQ